MQVQSIDDSDDDETFGVQSSRKRWRRKTTETTFNEEAREAATPSNLSDQDPGNFLKLCLAIQLLTSRRITEAELVEADNLLWQYCLELVEVNVSLSFSYCF